MTIKTLACSLILSIAVLSGSSADEMAESDMRLQANGGNWQLDRTKINDPTLPRALLIGDSIMIGYKKIVYKELKGKANVDAWTNPYFHSEKLNQKLSEVLDSGPYDIVHFNIGLHGWQEGRIKPGTYEPLMLAFLSVIRKKLPNAKIVWANTTPVTTKERPFKLDSSINNIIVEHNQLAVGIMKNAGIPVNDFYGLLADHLNLAQGDGFHWTPTAYQMLASKTTASVMQQIDSMTKLGASTR